MFTHRTHCTALQAGWLCGVTGHACRACSCSAPPWQRIPLSAAAHDPSHATQNSTRNITSVNSHDTLRKRGEGRDAGTAAGRQTGRWPQLLYVTCLQFGPFGLRGKKRKEWRWSGRIRRDALRDWHEWWANSFSSSFLSIWKTRRAMVRLWYGYATKLNSCKFVHELHWEKWVQICNLFHFSAFWGLKSLM